MNEKIYMTSFNESLDPSEIAKNIDVAEMIRQEIYDVYAGNSSGYTLDEAVENVDEDELDYQGDELSVFEIECSLNVTIKKVGTVVRSAVQFKPIEEAPAKKPAKKKPRKAPVKPSKKPAKKAVQW